MLTAKLGISSLGEMEKRIYILIHEHGPISKAEIEEKAKLKQTTVNRIFESLLSKKLIVKFGYARSTFGRPPAIYVINSDFKHLIGIDISRTKTTVLLSNLLFTEIESKSFLMTESHTPEKTLHLIKEIIKSLLNNNNLNIDDILGIGIGAVGPLNRQDGMIVNPPLFKNDQWKDIQIVDYFKSEFPVHIVLESGGNAAVIGEYSKSSLSCSNLLYCISNRGIRCGVYSDDRLVHNKAGDTIAFGHTIVEINGRLCVCGNKGCLNTYVSSTSIVKEVKREIANGVNSILQNKIENLDISDIIYGLEKDDYLTKEVVSQSTMYYGIGLANLINLYNPELVILSGFLFERSNFYYESVIKHALKNTYPGNSNKVLFSKGSLGENAIALGASIVAFKSVFELI